MRSPDAQRVGEHLSPAARPHDERALDGQLRQCLHEPLGHRAPGHDVRDDAALAQRRCRGRADRGDPCARQRPRVAAAGCEPLEQSLHAVCARHAHEVIARRIERRARQRPRADGGDAHDLRAELAQP